LLDVLIQEASGDFAFKGGLGEDIGGLSIEFLEFDEFDGEGGDAVTGGGGVLDSLLDPLEGVVDVLLWG
jgi:hypothetical protein